MILPGDSAGMANKPFYILGIILLLLNTFFLFNPYPTSLVYITSFSMNVHPVNYLKYMVLLTGIVSVLSFIWNKRATGNAGLPGFTDSQNQFQ